MEEKGSRTQVKRTSREFTSPMGTDGGQKDAIGSDVAEGLQYLDTDDLEQVRRRLIHARGRDSDILKELWSLSQRMSRVGGGGGAQMAEVLDDTEDWDDDGFCLQFWQGRGPLPARTIGEVIRDILDADESADPSAELLLPVGCQLSYYGQLERRVELFDARIGALQASCAAQYAHKVPSTVPSLPSPLVLRLGGVAGPVIRTSVELGRLATVLRDDLVITVTLARPARTEAQNRGLLLVNEDAGALQRVPQATVIQPMVKFVPSQARHVEEKDVGWKREEDEESEVIFGGIERENASYRKPTSTDEDQSEVYGSSNHDPISSSLHNQPILIESAPSSPSKDNDPVPLPGSTRSERQLPPSAAVPAPSPASQSLQASLSRSQALEVRQARLRLSVEAAARSRRQQQRKAESRPSPRPSPSHTQIGSALAIANASFRSAEARAAILARAARRSRGGPSFQVGRSQEEDQTHQTVDFGTSLPQDTSSFSFPQSTDRHSSSEHLGTLHTHNDENQNDNQVTTADSMSEPRGWNVRRTVPVSTLTSLMSSDSVSDALLTPPRHLGSPSSSVTGTGTDHPNLASPSSYQPYGRVQLRVRSVQPLHNVSGDGFVRRIPDTPDRRFVGSTAFLQHQTAGDSTISSLRLSQNSSSSSSSMPAPKRSNTSRPDIPRLPAVQESTVEKALSDRQTSSRQTTPRRPEPTRAASVDESKTTTTPNTARTTPSPRKTTPRHGSGETRRTPITYRTDEDFPRPDLEKSSATGPPQKAESIPDLQEDNTRPDTELSSEVGSLGITTMRTSASRLPPGKRAMHLEVHVPAVEEQKQRLSLPPSPRQPDPSGGWDGSTGSPRRRRHKMPRIRSRSGVALPPKPPNSPPPPDDEPDKDEATTPKQDKDKEDAPVFEATLDLDADDDDDLPKPAENQQRSSSPTSTRTSTTAASSLPRSASADPRTLSHMPHHAKYKRNSTTGLPAAATMERLAPAPEVEGENDAWADDDLLEGVDGVKVTRVDSFASTPSPIKRRREDANNPNNNSSNNNNGNAPSRTASSAQNSSVDRRTVTFASSRSNSHSNSRSTRSSRSGHRIIGPPLTSGDSQGERQTDLATEEGAVAIRVASAATISPEALLRARMPSPSRHLEQVPEEDKPADKHTGEEHGDLGGKRALEDDEETANSSTTETADKKPQAGAANPDEDEVRRSNGLERSSQESEYPSNSVSILAEEAVHSPVGSLRKEPEREDVEGDESDWQRPAPKLGKAGVRPGSERSLMPSRSGGAMLTALRKVGGSGDIHVRSSRRIVGSSPGQTSTASPPQNPPSLNLPESTEGAIGQTSDPDAQLPLPPPVDTRNTERSDAPSNQGNGPGVWGVGSRHRQMSPPRSLQHTSTGEASPPLEGRTTPPLAPRPRSAASSTDDRPRPPPPPRQTTQHHATEPHHKMQLTSQPTAEPDDFGSESVHSFESSSQTSSHRSRRSSKGNGANPPVRHVHRRPRSTLIPPRTGSGSKVLDGVRARDTQFVREDLSSLGAESVEEEGTDEEEEEARRAMAEAAAATAGGYGSVWKGSWLNSHGESASQGPAPIKSAAYHQQSTPSSQLAPEAGHGAGFAISEPSARSAASGDQSRRTSASETSEWLRATHEVHRAQERDNESLPSTRAGGAQGSEVSDGWVMTTGPNVVGLGSRRERTNLRVDVEPDENQGRSLESILHSPSLGIIHLEDVSSIGSSRPDASTVTATATLPASHAPRQTRRTPKSVVGTAAHPQRHPSNTTSVLSAEYPRRPKQTQVDRSGRSSAVHQNS